jgi:hypothetical protein
LLFLFVAISEHNVQNIDGHLTLTCSDISFLSSFAGVGGTFPEKQRTWVVEDGQMV